jgi:8-oxo-dGTP diphosphatase
VRAGDDAADARWFALDALPPLAFDHKKILETAWGRLLVMPSAEEDGRHVAMERGTGQVLTTLTGTEQAEALVAAKPTQG